MQNHQKLIDNLAWIATIDDIDHDICDAAREAKSVIENQEEMIQILAENEKRLREELDKIHGIIR